MAGPTSIGAPSLNHTEELEVARKTVTAPDLTPPVGPFAQGVWAGDLLYASGQVGQDPVTGTMVAGGIEAETGQAFENMRRVLAAAGLGFEHVIKAHVFLADIEDFAAMNAIYGKVFTAPFPARTTVQVAKLALNARVEIDVVARRPEA
jgi:2-iminobutanoate/2-iminopropanoate deaminase